MKKTKRKILFLCTGNSCRSQMAEGFGRHLKADSFESFSAGTAPQGLNPRAVKVMAESGVDISRQKSKHADSLKNIPFDFVITVCDHANENCPLWLAGSGNKTKVIHVGFDDPPALAKTAKSEEEALEHYRRVRDEIKSWIHTLPDSLMNFT